MIKKLICLFKGHDISTRVEFVDDGVNEIKTCKRCGTITTTFIPD